MACRNVIQKPFAAFTKQNFTLGRFPKIILTLLLCSHFCFGALFLSAQENADQISIGNDGVMTWTETGKEVTGFGVNYTMPFAHVYRTATNWGHDVKSLIDQDVFQFSRLGFDLFRVHVWDCEISDTLGNLLVNEHLEAFDYLLKKLNDNGIRAVITPIAYWGNGWPEPDEKTPGFSTKYGKAGCLTDNDALLAQKRYLQQFVSHVNPHTGIAYKDDPNILAFEISNEPHHRGSGEMVTAFVHELKESIRETGCTKPIFYNVTHSVHLADAYYKAGIDGGTFQWYPTGLGFQKSLQGNLLPNVDGYAIPFDPVMKEYGSARLVYEFDAADMPTTAMYPAMARSFRTAGMQIATHFAYDPTFLAPYNTEYNTHFMNLIYAPRKALALMIAGEVFRHIPLYSDYGTYPDNTSFGPFRIDTTVDLAEMVTEDKFYYTYHTTTAHPSPDSLKHIAGWGNSSVVQYGGTGAYFLDKIAEGIWVLEVYPDAIMLDNVFGRNNLETRRAAIHHREWPMHIELPDFDRGVFVGEIESGDTRELNKAAFDVAPGVYLLTTPEVVLDRAGFMQAWTYLDSANPAEFYNHIVGSNLEKTLVRTQIAPEVTAGKSVPLLVQVASANAVDSVHLWVYKGWEPVSIPMKWQHGFTYRTTIPAEYVTEGELRYYIQVHGKKHSTLYPANTSSHPGRWDFDARQTYTVRVVPPQHPIYLFNATSDTDRLNRDWLPGATRVPGEYPGEDFLFIRTEQLYTQDPENLYGEKIGDYSMRHFFGDLIKGRSSDLSSKENLVVQAHSRAKGGCPVQVALVMKDGSAFGAQFTLSSKTAYTIPLKKLKRVKAVLLPRPYPTFLPYYSKAGKATTLRLQDIESLQISIGPGIPESKWDQPYEFSLGRVWIE